MNRWIWGEYRDWGVLEGHPDPRDPLITSQCVAYDIYWTALTEGYGQTDRGRSEGVDPRSKGVIWGSKGVIYGYRADPDQMTSSVCLLIGPLEWDGVPATSGGAQFVYHGSRQVMR